MWITKSIDLPKLKEIVNI